MAAVGQLRQHVGVGQLFESGVELGHLGVDAVQLDLPLEQLLLERDDPLAGVQPGQKLADMIRLGQVVVGSGFQSGNDLLFLAVGREQNKIHISHHAKLLERTDRAAQLQPVHLGHHPVGDDHARAGPLDLLEGQPAVLAGHDLIAGLLKLAHEQAAGGGIVFCDDDRRT